LTHLHSHFGPDLRTVFFVLVQLVYRLGHLGKLGLDS
jgi:hypothetical protein